MPGASLRNGLTRLAKRYAEALPGSPAGSYLEGRGFDENAARIALLGLCSDPDPDHEQMENMLAIPYRTPAGVVGFKFRDLRPEAKLKYLNPAGQKARLFNVGAFHRAGDFIAICEGEIDALTLDILCDIPAVSVPGATAWNAKVYPRCFEGFSKVWVFADHDRLDDGRNPGYELWLRIKDTVPQASLVRLAQGTDVNETYLSEGREELRAKIGLD